MKGLILLHIVMQMVLVRAHAQLPPTFTRTVQQLTGTESDTNRIIGQDSAIILPYKDKVLFFFGDSVIHQDPLIYLPNTMGYTSDIDASDGLRLTYYEEGNGLKNVLKYIPPEEKSVWLMNAFQYNDDIYSFYFRVNQGWPDGGTSLGSGIAVMRSGTPPFERTNTVFLPGHILAGSGSSFVEGDYLYIFATRTVNFNIILARVLLSELEDVTAYSYWNGAAWVSDQNQAIFVINNSLPPVVHWHPYLNKYLALCNPIYTATGFGNQVTVRTADQITGPWSDETKLVELLPDENGNRSLYNPYWDPIFNRDNGRVFYHTATTRGIYNVFLRETSFNFARTEFVIKNNDADAYQKISLLNPDRGSANTNSSRLQLRDGGKSIVGFRFYGDSFYPRSDVVNSKLILPLTRSVSRPVEIELRISVGVPNDWAFTSIPNNNLIYREKLGEVSVSHTIYPGETEIILENKINSLLDLASQHMDWDAGNKHFLPLYIERLDLNSRDRLYIQGTNRKGLPTAKIEVCYGECQ